MSRSVERVQTGIRIEKRILTAEDATRSGKSTRVETTGPPAAPGPVVEEAPALYHARRSIVAKSARDPNREVALEGFPTLQRQAPAARSAGPARGDGSGRGAEDAS